jgi:hypothetical protein
MTFISKQLLPVWQKVLERTKELKVELPVSEESAPQHRTNTADGESDDLTI